MTLGPSSPLDGYSALCVGGPQHGRVFAAEALYFMVLRHPTYSASHTLYEGYEHLVEGIYLYEELETGDPEGTPIWRWKGWRE